MTEFNSIEGKLTLIFGNHGSLVFWKANDDKGEFYIVYWNKYFDVV